MTALGTRRIRATVDGVSFEATLGAYGGRTFLGLRKQVLTDLGVAAGDSVHVELEALPPEPVDDEPPAPTTCAELDDAVRDDKALAGAWADLTDAGREEYGRWISGGQDPEIRLARVARLQHRLVPGC